MTNFIYIKTRTTFLEVLSRKRSNNQQQVSIQQTDCKFNYNSKNSQKAFKQNMKGSDDHRKNNIPYRNMTNTNNNNLPNHNIINTKDYHKPLLTRQRQNQKNFEDKSQTKYQQYDSNNKILKQLSTKQIKSTSSSKSQTHLKKPVQQHLPHPPPQHPIIQPNTQGISINVNIQNLITPKHLQNMHHYGILKEQRKSAEKQNISNNNQHGKKIKKIVNNKTQVDCLQFQCNEELSTVLVPRNLSPPVQWANPRQRKQQQRTHRSKQPIQLPQKPKQKQLSPQQIIKKYQISMQQLKNNFNSQCLIYLDTRQHLYLINPKYIEYSQPNFNWKMRAQVIQWMMQVSYEYQLKRQTFHISINLIDRYLSREKNLARSDFQLAGAASMFIASKLEQFQPKKSQEFVKATDNAFTSSRLKQMQKRICQILQYNLNPPTLFRWANRLMAQWDLYLKTNLQVQKHSAYPIVSKVNFKQCDEQSYINFRILMQLIDCSTLDIQTTQYNPKLLVCAFLYLYIGKETKLFSTKDIVHKFPYSSLYLLDQKNMYTDLFDIFLQFTFGFEILDLLPTIQYCASYFSLPPNVEMPASKSNPQAYQNMELEQYCSIQTFDRNMLPIVSKRVRDIHI